MLFLSSKPLGDEETSGIQVTKHGDNRQIRKSDGLIYWCFIVQNAHPNALCRP